MANDEWYKARGIIEDILVKDLLGPVSDDEIIDEPPLSYYTIGKLYPQQSEIEVTEIEEAIIDGIEEDVGESFDECISLTNTFNPSSMAVTFTLSANAAGLKAVVKGARYEPVNLAELIERQDYGNRYAWRRKPFEKIIDFSLESHDKAIMVENITEDLEGRLYIHKAFTDGDVSATFAVVNTYMSLSNAVFDNEHSFFQIEVSLESRKEGEEIFVEKTMHAVPRHDPELMASDMLYRNVRNYAVGHGCSVGWVDGVAGASKIFTQFIPRHELLQMRSVARIDSPVFKMSFLAFSDRNVIVEELKKFIASYKSWISRCKETMHSLDPKYIEAANKNMEKCDEAALRMAKCVELLEKNDDVMRAFQLANQAMLLQREQTLTKEGKTCDPDMVKWYPFQLGFILQEIPSIDDPADDYRDVVDLLWFPTGGGKT